MSVYGQGSRYGSRPLAQMKLQYCEGHVLGQVYSAVRGYVWRDKVTPPLLSTLNTTFKMSVMKFQQNTLQFYGTVITEADTLHIEPLVQLGPVQTTNKVAGVVTMRRPIVSLSYLDSQCLRLQSFLQTRIS